VCIFSSILLAAAGSKNPNIVPEREAYQPFSPCQAGEVMSAQETGLYKIRLAFPGALFYLTEGPRHSLMPTYKFSQDT